MLAGAAARCFVRPWDCGGDITAMLYMYSQIYAAQIVLVTLLSAVTIYRREMSCNHEYSSSPSNRSVNSTDAAATPTNVVGQDNNSRGLVVGTNKNNNKKGCDENSVLNDWDEALEDVGKWGSGKPLADIICSLWSILIHISTNGAAGGGTRSRRRQVRRRKGTCTYSDEWERPSLVVEDEGGPWSTAVLSMFWARLWWTSLYDGSYERPASKKATFVMASTWSSKPSRFFTELLPDVQVHILSFLDPRDVTSFACCDQRCNDLVDNAGNDTCLHLWKTLWDRDYAWLVQEWMVGVEAKRRSVFDRPIDKRLYMEFGQTFINYLLVGHNKMDDCLVGLYGNIYDLTNFLEAHPGSPETLLVHAGQDATPTFESIGHSMSARKRAPQMCIVVDKSCYGGWGIAPSILGGDKCTTSRASANTPHSGIDSSSNQCIRSRSSVTTGGIIPFQSSGRRPPTLLQIRDRLHDEERDAQRAFARMVPSNSITGTATVYYDCFDREWKAWYTDTLLETRHLYRR